MRNVELAINYGKYHHGTDSFNFATPFAELKNQYNSRIIMNLRNPTSRLDGKKTHNSWRKSTRILNREKLLQKLINSPFKQEEDPNEEFTLEFPYNALRREITIGGFPMQADSLVNAFNTAEHICDAQTGFADMNTTTFTISCTKPIDPYFTAENIVRMFPDSEKYLQEIVANLQALLEIQNIKPTQTKTSTPTQILTPTAVFTPTPPNLPKHLSPEMATDIAYTQLRNYKWQLALTPTPTEIPVETKNKIDSGSMLDYFIGLTSIFFIFYFLKDITPKH